MCRTCFVPVDKEEEEDCEGLGCHSSVGVLTVWCWWIVKRMSTFRAYPTLTRNLDESAYQNLSRWLLRVGLRWNRRQIRRNDRWVVAYRIFVIFGHPSHGEAFPRWDSHLDWRVDRNPRSARTHPSAYTNSPSLNGKVVGVSLLGAELAEMDAGS